MRLGRTEAAPRRQPRRRFRPARAALVLLLVVSGCADTSWHADVLGQWEGTSSLEFNRCRVGVGHYAGVTPFGLTGDKPIVLESVWLTTPKGLTASAQIAHFDSGYVGGLDGDQAFARESSRLRLMPVKGATVTPGDEPFYILVKVVAEQPGPLTTDAVHVLYRVDGRLAVHTFELQLIVNDYEAPASEPECLALAGLD